MTLGTYPALTLAEAREAWRQARQEASLPPTDPITIWVWRNVSECIEMLSEVISIHLNEGEHHV